LVNRLKEEYKIYYILNQQKLNEKFEQKYMILKSDIEESKQTVSLLNAVIKNYITKYRNIEKMKGQIEFEKQKDKQIKEENKKFCEFIEKGKKTLIQNIKYYNKLHEYSNKKFNSVKISPIDLINFTLRISQQSKFHMEAEYYFSKYLPIQGKKNILLRYDLSQKNQLLPPILESPLPNTTEKGVIIANKGKDLIFKYPGNNPPSEIVFKYSRDPKILPSFFTGEEYNCNDHPVLDKDCIIKVCTCSKGFRDSKILTLKFRIIVADSAENRHVKIANTEPSIDKLHKDTINISKDGPYIGKISSSHGMYSSSPYNLSRQGSSQYDIICYNPEDDWQDDEEDEDNF